MRIAQTFRSVFFCVWDSECVLQFFCTTTGSDASRGKPLCVLLEILRSLLLWHIANWKCFGLLQVGFVCVFFWNECTLRTPSRFLSWWTHVAIDLPWSVKAWCYLISRHVYDTSTSFNPHYILERLRKPQLSFLKRPCQRAPNCVIFALQYSEHCSACGRLA